MEMVFRNEFWVQDMLIVAERGVIFHALSVDMGRSSI